VKVAGRENTVFLAKRLDIDASFEFKPAKEPQKRPLSPLNF